MNRRHFPWFVFLVAWLALPAVCPAPLVFVPGEGWRYESAGGGTWTRERAEDQYQVAKEAFDNKDYRLALKASRRTVSVWPYSDFAPQAQFLLAQCYEARRKDEAAFKALQKLVQQYPKEEEFDRVLETQFNIATRFLNGQWFRVWNLIPVYPSMDKTIKLYEQIIKNGPFSEVAPKSQMNIATAYENKMVPDYEMAAKAYERAADRYNQEQIGIDALYMVGITYNRMSKDADYDQSIASKAINTFTDFIALYPDDPRVDEARRLITALKLEQARGSLSVARFYEKKKKWLGAQIYYNDVLNILKEMPETQYAEQARKRIEMIQKRRNP